MTATAEEFLVRAVKYVFRAECGTETRGVAAACRPPLMSEMADDGLLPVWPHSIARPQRDSR